MLRPTSLPRHPHWYEADAETVKPLFGVPGLKFHPKMQGLWLVHRTHLPLLDTDEARRILMTGLDQLGQQWQSRDQFTAARGFKLRTLQQQALDYISPRRGVLLGDEMRTGKGHVVGTNVLTPIGWKKIEQIAKGTYVVGSDGKPCRVVGVFFRGVLPVFRVGFSDGSSLRVDGDHLWTVWHHNAWHRGQSSKTLSTRVLASKLRDGANNLKWRIPLVRPIEFYRQTLPIDPYLLGALLGDGSLTTRSTLITAGNDAVPEEMAKVLPHGIQLRRRKTDSGKAMSWGLSRTGAKNALLHDLMALGLRVKSPEKFVPDCYLFGDFGQRLALLQGLMDTDGELTHGKTQFVGFSSASRRLAENVQFLVESFGGVARLTVKLTPKYPYRGEIRAGLPAYRLSISMPAGICPFRARKGYVDRKKFVPARHIRSIEADGEAEVICISVDAPDQLYVTERCIVTHNTASCVMSHDPARGPLVVVAPLSARAVWLGWIKKVFPDVPIGVLTGKRKIEPERLKRPIVFCHYDILRHWQSMMKIGTLVFDECHYLINAGSDRSKACVLLAAQASKVIAATGTPIWSLPSDLWNIIAILAPGAWASYWDFGRRYGDPFETEYGVEFRGISNKTELTARLSEIMIRRLWRDVSTDLPPISRSVVVVDIDDATRRKLDVLAAKIKTERTNTAGNLAHYRSQISPLKKKIILKEATQILDRGEPVVIWTWHKELANVLYNELAHDGRAFLIHGDIAADQREERMQAWRDAERPSALISTMAVAQVAVDLSHAHIALVAELDYVPGVLGQMEMRTYSPDHPMNVTYFVADHVVDQRLVRSLINKLNAADPIGLGTAIDAIGALRDALDGPTDDGDMVRFLDDLLANT